MMFTDDEAGDGDSGSGESAASSDPASRESGSEAGDDAPRPAKPNLRVVK
jgi:hypothetical protein